MKKKEKEFLWATRENPCSRKIRDNTSSPEFVPQFYPNIGGAVRKFRKFTTFSPRRDSKLYANLTVSALSSRETLHFSRPTTWIYRSTPNPRIFFIFQLWGILDGNLLTSVWSTLDRRPTLSSSLRFRERGISRNSMVSRISRDSFDLSRFCLISYGFSTAVPGSLDLSAFWTFPRNHWKWI